MWRACRREDSKKIVEMGGGGARCVRRERLSVTLRELLRGENWETVGGLSAVLMNHRDIVKARLSPWIIIQPSSDISSNFRLHIYLTLCAITASQRRVRAAVSIPPV